LAWHAGHVFSSGGFVACGIVVRPRVFLYSRLTWFMIISLAVICFST
jgi:hypothetical protein